MGKAFVNYRIEERSFVSYIKREIHMEVSRAGFTERQIAEVDIIVSEATSNLVKHAGGGEVLYRTTSAEEGGPIFEFLCIDKGPGMSDLDKMMTDGISTTGTLGHGLGAIQRLSTHAQVYTQPGTGTIIYSVVSRNTPKKVRKAGGEVEIRALCVNKPRETVCGDGYHIISNNTATRVFFGDGLGHGQHAKAAIDSATEYFTTSDEPDPVHLIRGMHEKVRRTRGLVAAIAILDKTRSEWKICGVGNIAVRVFSGLQGKNYMSYNGTVGLNIPSSLKESAFPVEKNQHLIMCTDGIRSRWSLSQYPGILKYDSSVLAAALYRDYSRGNDDASVLIAKVT